MKNKLWKGLKPKILKNNKENNLFLVKSEENPEISWRFRDFFLPLPSLNNTERYRSGGGERRPSDDSGHFFMLILPRPARGLIRP